MLRNCVFITIFLALADQVGALKISMQKKRSNPDGPEDDDTEEYEAALREATSGHGLDNEASGKPALSGSTPGVDDGPEDDYLVGVSDLFAETDGEAEKRREAAHDDVADASPAESASEESDEPDRFEKRQILEQRLAQQEMLLACLQGTQYKGKTVTTDDLSADDHGKVFIMYGQTSWADEGQKAKFLALLPADSDKKAVAVQVLKQGIANANEQLAEFDAKWPGDGAKLVEEDRTRCQAFFTKRSADIEADWLALNDISTETDKRDLDRLLEKTILDLKDYTKNYEDARRVLEEGSDNFKRDRFLQDQKLYDAVRSSFSMTIDFTESTIDFIGTGILLSRPTPDQIESRKEFNKHFQVLVEDRDAEKIKQVVGEIVTSVSGLAKRRRIIEQALRQGAEASRKPALSGSTPGVVSGARNEVLSNQQRQAMCAISTKTQSDGTSVARSDSGADSPSADREDEIRAQLEALASSIESICEEYGSDSDNEKFGSTGVVKLVEQLEDRKRKTEWKSKNQIPLIRNGFQHIAMGAASPVVLPIGLLVLGANVCPSKYGLIPTLLGAGAGATFGAVIGALSAVRCTLNGTAQIVGSGVYKSKHFLKKHFLKRRRSRTSSTRKV